MAMTARHFVENVMLSYDDSLKDKQATRLQHWLTRHDSPEFVERLAGDLEKKSLMTDWLRVDLALVYHYFAQSTGEARWREGAFASLAHVKDQKGSYYFLQVDATLRGVPLSEADRADLAGYCAKWPEDWWICQLAHAQGMDDRYDPTKIERREKRAGWQLLTQFVMQCLLTFAGLVLAWPAWRLF